ncbi:hypothetical protein CASFOL_007654 [Castilleja foliolosa]|uniref:Uncharacterized protein n=1 Tax=Castilleja foliolosa TaxID=1961234 RepID=A0ABD3E154_9LAMI
MEDLFGSLKADEGGLFKVGHVVLPTDDDKQLPKNLPLLEELNSEPVIPEGFPEWRETMDSRGYKMVYSIEAVVEMAAIGIGLQKDAFISLMKALAALLLT